MDTASSTMRSPRCSESYFQCQRALVALSTWNWMRRSKATGKAKPVICAFQTTSLASGVYPVKGSNAIHLPPRDESPFDSGGGFGRFVPCLQSATRLEPPRLARDRIDELEFRRE
jgi:hypothetical protein